MRLLSLTLACCLTFFATASIADELADQVKEDPNNADLLLKLLNNRFSAISAQLGSDPDAAEELLTELGAFLADLDVEDADAKSLMARAEAAIEGNLRHIEVLRTPLDELVAKLMTDPDDVEVLTMFQNKVNATVTPIARSNPDEAAAVLVEARDVLTKLTELTEDEDTKRMIARIETSLNRYDSTIETGRKLIALIGKDAAELENITAWVNGEPLTSESLEGKVVFLDFWAVWCGPCIATFPHLREWNEKYADKGLVMIGLTRYYNYDWNEEAGRATRSQEEVPHEQEHAMLKRFAEEHELNHVFAVQDDSALSEFYGVTGIPHVVVIDREGKIRMIRVGSGEQNAKDLGELLEELINKE